MRESVGIPAGVLVYFMSVILCLIFVQVGFADPGNWPTLITTLTAVVSFKVTCAAVENFSNSDGVKVVGIIIAMFWLLSLGVDMFSGLEELIKFLSGGTESTGLEDFRALVDDVWNSKLCAIISVLLAMWTLNK